MPDIHNDNDNYILIGVGSTSPAKVNPVIAAARTYWENRAEVRGFDNISSGVPTMPLTQGEMRTGAKNRAQQAFRRICDERTDISATLRLGIGIEGGIDRCEGTPILMSYIAITDGHHLQFTPTTGTPLPQAWIKTLNRRFDIRQLLRSQSRAYDETRGANEILTLGHVGRDEAMTLAMKSAFVPWVNPDMYNLR